MFAGGLDETWHVSKSVHPCESKREGGMGQGLGSGSSHSTTSWHGIASSQRILNYNLAFQVIMRVYLSI